MTTPTPEEEEVVEILRRMLPSPAWGTPVIVQDVRLEGGFPRTRLVVELKKVDRPELVYGLVTVLSDWDFEGAGLSTPSPEGWAGWVHDDLMEAVDAAPGLPLGPINDDGIIWVDLDA